MLGGFVSGLPDFAWNWILHSEGDKEVFDTGLRSIYGISERAHPEAWANGAPSWQSAREIYAGDYWLKHHCDMMPIWAAMLLFDGVVQHSPSVAVRIFQRSIGSTDDGVVGPKTVAAAKFAIPKTTIPLYLADRADYYASLTRTNRKFMPYSRGWFARLFRLQAFIIDECGRLTPEFTCDGGVA